MTRRGFTLIEMLVVIAILGILMGLLFIPLTRSFGFVGAEQAEIALHDTTRETMRTVTGQIADAMQITTFTNAATYNPTRIDLLMPANSILNQPYGNGSGVPMITGQEPGVIHETFFVGLLDPTQPYNNPVSRAVSGGVTDAQTTPENEYIIWRALYNLDDSSDPVAAAGGAAALTNPWLFDDSLKGPLAVPAPVGAIPFANIACSNASKALLLSMRNYTTHLTDGHGNYILSNGKPVLIGAALTPVAVLGHMDAVQSVWDSAVQGWQIDPRVTFLPSASVGEVMQSSQNGTEFLSSRGLWTNGQVEVYWGSGWNLHYQGPQTPANPFVGATLDGTIPGDDGNPMNIAVLNGPAAGTVVTTSNANLGPFFLDPRTGRMDFTQFQVTEVIKVQSGVNHYQLGFPTTQTTNFATLLDNTNNPVGQLRPQIIPFSETLSVVPNGASTATTYQRLTGTVQCIDPRLLGGDQTAVLISQGAYPAGSSMPAGNYAILYTANPDVSNAPAYAQPFQPTEVPTVDVPLAATDPNVSAGAYLRVTYRFTFATLDASGASLVKAAASYSSQQFVHVNIGLRNYDVSTLTPHDYSLSNSVGAGNPQDEQPNTP